jgi:hypothetical protein
LVVDAGVLWLSQAIPAFASSEPEALLTTHSLLPGLAGLDHIRRDEDMAMIADPIDEV